MNTKTVIHRRPGQDKTLYSRSCQKQILLDALKQTIATNGRRFVLISGDSGVGKTALASSLQIPVQRCGGQFLQGKFDQFQHKSQNNVIANAIGQYAANIRNDTTLINRLRNALGKEMRCLVDMIPALAELFPETQEIDNDSDAKANEWMQDMTTRKSRTHGAFLKFVAEACSPSRPLVLFVDDLQWASKGDYHVIRDLLTATDEDIKGILLVGACRVVDKGHELVQFIRDLSNDVSVTDVVLSNLSAAEVEAYIADVFPRMEGSELDLLAKIVFHQTDGNFFFIKLYITDLIDAALVVVRDDGTVTLDRARLEIRARSDDVVHFIVANLRQLPPELQSLLQAASCLGEMFGMSLLEYVVTSDSRVNQSIKDLVESCAERGVLSVKSSSGERSFETDPLWGFQHDRLQQASYMLIPEDMKESFHLSIGRCLLDRMNSRELEKHLLMVTNHLVFGANLITSQKEKDQVATLCLRAGQKSAYQCDFDSAGGYIDAGLSFLGEDKWDCNYELCLRLFNAGAEISYVRVEFQRLEELVTEVFHHAKSFDDKIEAHTTHIYALGTRHMLREAIAEGVKVLDKLGEPLPSSFSMVGMRYKQYRTQILLSNYTERSLLDLPSMRDPKKLAAMRLLNLLYSYTFWSGDFRSFWITYRSVEMSLEHGLCAMSGVAISVYAGYICMLGEVGRGNRYGQLAMRIIERFHSKQWSGRVGIIVDSFVKGWKYSISEYAETMKLSFKLSLATGDTEYAMLGRGLHVTYSFKMGQHLGACYQIAIEYHEQLVKHEQNVVRTLFEPILQAIANLFGKSVEPLVLTGEFMDEGKSIAAGEKTGNRLALETLYMAKAIVAFFLQEFQLASEWAKKSRPLKKGWNMCGPMVFMQIFFEGMGHVVSLRPNIRGAKGCLGELRRHARSAPSVLCMEIFLLEAELASLKGNDHEAQEKFELAISVAQRRGVIHEQAFACERAAQFMTKIGRSSKATQYLDEAVELYKRWGFDLVVKRKQCQDKSLAVQ